MENKIIEWILANLSLRCSEHSKLDCNPQVTLDGVPLHKVKKGMTSGDLTWYLFFAESVCSAHIDAIIPSMFQTIWNRVLRTYLLMI
jgi:hypothetical protein